MIDRIEYIDCHCATLLCLHASSSSRRNKTRWSRRGSSSWPNLHACMQQPASHRWGSGAPRSPRVLDACALNPQPRVPSTLSPQTLDLSPRVSAACPLNAQEYLDLDANRQPHTSVRLCDFKNVGGTNFFYSAVYCIKNSRIIRGMTMVR